MQAPASSEANESQAVTRMPAYVSKSLATANCSGVAYLVSGSPYPCGSPTWPLDKPLRNIQIVKPFWLVLLVACSREQAEPRDQVRPTHTASRRSIDVTVKDAPLSIRGVELTPSPRSPGVLELGYRVESRDASVRVPARIMCRVSGYNVIYPSGSEGKVAGPRLAALYRPDPFNEPADACEVTFLLHDQPIAAACYRDGELVDGACPAGTFPPPPRATSFSVEIARAALELRHGTALVSGLFTLAEPLAAGRRFATQIRCEDDAGVATGEGELAFLPLDRIPVGASVYGPVAIFLDRTPEPSATCELRIVSRAIEASPTEQIHARYCLTTGAVRAGPCP